jgi:Fur family peroxide stress response transcriptional regulator
VVKVAGLEVERRLERFKVAAREAGIKLTHQRLEIFREVAASLEHPDAETAFRAVRARMPTVSLDTVYRTLWMLTDLGLISTLGPRRESARFDANPEPHHHYVCVRCGLTRDFESAALNALPVPGAVRGFGGVVATRVEVRGLCRKCTQEEAEKSAPRKPRPPQGGKRRRT